MALSPMMKHYLSVKENYKDCVLFYRLGDFYEMFYDDAVRVSELLDLTLTGRDCGLPERAPMCGIPFHAADVYIAKLVSLGEKVAICEQLTEPNGQNLVERSVIRVVTAGTLIEDNLIDEKTNNYLGCVYFGESEQAFSWVDITTGEFFVKPFKCEDGKLLDILVKVAPAEIIANEKACKYSGDLSLIKHKVLPAFSLYRESEFNIDLAKNVLKEQFNVKNLSSFGLEGEDASISAAGALVSYLKETQMHSLKNITGIICEKNNEFMALDINAIRNLELTKTLRDGKKYGSLLWVLDKTKTSMGARTLQNWVLSPLQDKEEIEKRLDGVDELFKNNLIRQGITDLFKGVKDIGRITGKISNGNLMPRDCVALAESLEVLPSLKFQLSGMGSRLLNEINYSITDFTELVKLLHSAINENPPAAMKDGGFIKDGYNKELDEYRSYAVNGKSMIAEIEARERQKTGIKNLRISYNRIFGYYIEVTNSFKEMVPYEYQRKQTLANCERFVTDELKEVEVKLITAQEKSLKLEQSLYSELKERLASEIDKLQQTALSLGVLDSLVSLAQVAKQNNYAKPEISESGKPLDIVQGRHPVVEAVSKEQFVPNDVYMDSGENRTLIITGPNMAGKSTFMRQVALITLMAHIGSFVPAKSAVIPLTDKIFTRVGASDNLISDQSTFMVEMNEVASILRNATDKSLLILDEIGRGTSTFDGLSIAWAVVEYLNEKIKAKTLFATHYHELTELEGSMYGVKNYKVTVKELNNSIVFMRKIMRGGANRSFGIEVAALAGVPEEVTEKAKKVLKSLESEDIRTKVDGNHDEAAPAVSEVERILKDIDVNNITPMQAFNILQDLKEKAGE